jgi:hypothetical protein
MFIDSPLDTLWVPHLPAYREAGGWAAQFEMSVRMTSEALFSAGTGKALESLFDAIVEELGPHLAPEQLGALTSVPLCDLRNDLLHCRFSRAYGKLGGKTNDPSVFGVAKIGDGESVLDAVKRAVSGGAVPIAETKTADAGIVAWVAQAGSRGTFADAARAFEGACLAMHVGLGRRAKAILARAGTEPSAG